MSSAAVAAAVAVSSAEIVRNHTEQARSILNGVVAGPDKPSILAVMSTYESDSEEMLNEETGYEDDQQHEHKGPDQGSIERSDDLEAICDEDDAAEDALMVDGEVTDDLKDFIMPYDEEDTAAAAALVRQRGVAEGSGDESGMDELNFTDASVLAMYIDALHFDALLAGKQLNATKSVFVGGGASDGAEGPYLVWLRSLAEYEDTPAGQAAVDCEGAFPDACVYRHIAAWLHRHEEYVATVSMQAPDTIGWTLPLLRHAITWHKCDDDDGGSKHSAKHGLVRFTVEYSAMHAGLHSDTMQRERLLIEVPQQVATSEMMGAMWFVGNMAFAVKCLVYKQYKDHEKEYSNLSVSECVTAMKEAKNSAFQIAQRTYADRKACLEVLCNPNM